MIDNKTEYTFYDSYKTEDKAREAVEYLKREGFKAIISLADSKYSPFNVYRSKQQE